MSLQGNTATPPPTTQQQQAGGARLTKRARLPAGRPYPPRPPADTACRLALTRAAAGRHAAGTAVRNAAAAHALLRCSRPQGRQHLERGVSRRALSWRRRAGRPCPQHLLRRVGARRRPARAAAHCQPGRSAGRRRPGREVRQVLRPCLGHDPSHPGPGRRSRLGADREPRRATADAWRPARRRRSARAGAARDCAALVQSRTRSQRSPSVVILGAVVEQRFDPEALRRTAAAPLGQCL